MKKQIIMASGNKGKIKEAQEILEEYEIIPMNEIGIDVDVEEDQNEKCAWQMIQELKLSI